MTRPFGPDYARGTLADDAAALLPRRHSTAEGRRDAVRAAARPLHPDVRDTLRQQNAALPETPARRRALEALDEAGVAFVVTGQQVGLFAGPLYSFWKAATAIVWAQRLSEETGHTVLPLFWLQTEDHDIDEIAGATLTDAAGGVHRVTVTSTGTSERAAVAHRRLGPDVDEAVARAEVFLRHLPHTERAIERLAASYRAGVPWHEGFCALAAETFADTALLFLQPRVEPIAQLAAPIHRRAATEHEAITGALAARATAIERAGYAVQVPIRDDCGLSFVHHPDASGDRHRIRWSPDGWTLADGQSDETRVDIDLIANTSPLRFGTSALLRPIVQDSLLPTAAYVGGPGELSYFAQLPPLYEHFGLPMPLVLPRATGTVADPATADDLAALGLTADDVDTDVDTLLERLGPPDGAPDFSALVASVRDAVTLALAPHRDAAIELDPHLESAVDKTVDAAARGAEKLHRKLESAALRADEARVARVRRVVARLRPGGAPQDRSLCWPDLAARIGPDAIAPTLLRAIDDALVDGELPPALHIDA